MVQSKKKHPILHTETFRTADGKGLFHYHHYQLREQIKTCKNEEFASNEFPFNKLEEQ